MEAKRKVRFGSTSSSAADVNSRTTDSESEESQTLVRRADTLDSDFFESKRKSSGEFGLNFLALGNRGTSTRSQGKKRASRSRIRNRANFPVTDTSEYPFPLEDLTVTPRITFSEDALIALRQQAWTPKIKVKNKLFNISDLNTDFMCSYSAAWTIGKRGCVAFQKLKLSPLRWVIGKTFALRFLVMDGTDCVSFLNIYRVQHQRNAVPAKVAVLTAEDLLHAQWDPVEGSFALTYQVKNARGNWRRQYVYVKNIPWKFFEAVITCLRELALWKMLASMNWQARQNALKSAQAKHFEAGGPRRLTTDVSAHPGRNRSKYAAAPNVQGMLQNIRRTRRPSLSYANNATAAPPD